MPELFMNLFRPNTPMVGTVISNTRLSDERHGDAHDVRHIVIRHEEAFPYQPGQSVGIVPPGINARNGRPHALRLYSLASDPHGDHHDNKTFSLCVVRHFFDNPVTGEKRVRGVCSNYLCDRKPGDTVQVTGPVGKNFVLPHDFQNRDIVFAATGTGIAPFRGKLRSMLGAGYSGQVFLYLGIPYPDSIPYNAEFLSLRAKYENFRYITAVSRGTEPNPIPDLVPTPSNKMYVQVRMFQDRERLKEVFSKPDSLLYLCGLKGMEDGIVPVVDRLGVDTGQNGTLAENLKKQGRLFVEVY